MENTVSIGSKTIFTSCKNATMINWIVSRYVYHDEPNRQGKFPTCIKCLVHVA